MLGAGLLATLLAFGVARHANRARFLAQVNRDVTLRGETNARSLELLELGLRSLRDHLQAHGDFDQAEFSRFSRPLLQAVRGIRAFEWLPRVMAGERASFERKAHVGLGPGFHIFERGIQGGFVPAGLREDFFPVLFAEPRAGNEPILGYDIGSSAFRRRDLDRARDSGEATGTDWFRMIQDPSGPKACYLVLPLYRKGVPAETQMERQAALRGFVLALVDTNTLLAAGRAKVLNLGFQAHLLDLSAAPERRFVVAWDPPPRTPSWRSLLIPAAPMVRAPLQVGDRHWELEAIPGVAYREQHHLLTHWLVLPVGFTTSLLLALLVRQTLSQRRKLEALVQERTERLQLILDSTAEGLLGVDPGGTCTFCNAAGLRLLGFERVEELLGRNLHSTVHHSHPDGRAYASEDCPILGAVQDPEGVHRAEEVFWRRDGSAFPVEYWSHPQLKAGRVEGAVVTFLDITEKREADRVLRTILKAIECSPASIIVTDAEGAIRFVNPAFTQVTGYALEEVLGQNPRILKSGIHPPAFYEEMWATLRAGRVWSGQILNRRKDGGFFTERASIAPILDGHGAPTNYVAIKEDITALLAAEAAHRVLVDSIPGAVYRCEVEAPWRMTYASEGFRSVTGRGAAEFVEGGFPYAALVHPEDLPSLKQAVAEAVAERRGFELEYRILLPNGESRWVTERGRAQHDPEGRPRWLDGVILDISRQKGEEARRAVSEATLRALLESKEDLIWSVDLEGRLTAFNRSLEEHFQRNYGTRAQLGVAAEAFLPPERRGIWPKLYARALAEGPYHLEYALSDGRVLDLSLNPIRQEGKAVGVSVFGADITARKAAERALSESQERLRNIVSAAPLGMLFYRLEADGRLLLVDANPAADRILGMSLGGRLGESLEAIFPALSSTPVPDTYRRIAEGEAGEQCFQIPYEDARIQGCFEVHAFPTGQNLVAVMFSDITQRLTAEQAVAESERQFRLLFMGAPVGIGRSTVDGRFLQVNPAMAEIFGYESPEAMLAAVNPVGVAHVLWEAPEEWAAFLTRTIARMGGYHSGEVRMRRRDGSPLDALLALALDRDSRAGEPSLTGFVQDITAAKGAEREIQNLKNNLSNIIDSMPAMLVGLDGEGRIALWNRRAESEGGFMADSALGRSFQEVLPAFAPWVEGLLQQVFEQGSPAMLERLLLEREGERHLYDLMLYPLVQAGNQGAVVRIEEVTERARIQELMVQTEKMMSVGGLAAGMAHEINNPLGIISQSAQNIERRLSPELPANQAAARELGLDLELVKAYFQRRQIPQFVAGILEAVNRSTRIVSNMLQFSRQTQGAKAPASLQALLEQSLELAANDFDLKKKYDFRSIELVKCYPEEAVMVPVVAIEIEQVLLNLLKNAAQAMAAQAGSEHPRLRLRVSRESRYGVIEVEDNGPGMEESVRARIFEPFFTTKEPGVGTGLGLSVSYTIITQNHKGLIEVGSKPGQGARFTIHLPLEPEAEHD